MTVKKAGFLSLAIDVRESNRGRERITNPDVSDSRAYCSWSSGERDLCAATETAVEVSVMWCAHATTAKTKN
jgi:hypothetical protein